MTDQTIQTHLAEIDYDLGFKTGLAINLLSRGHIAHRVDDLEKFKMHLKYNNINYSDWGETAVFGWKQIFFMFQMGILLKYTKKIEKSNKAINYSAA